MTPFYIPKGSLIRIGAPVIAPEPGLAAALAEIISLDSCVIEAHFILCQLPDMSQEFYQVIALIVNSGDERLSAVSRISNWVDQNIQSDRPFYVWPISPSNAIVKAVREANSALPLRPPSTG
jgi:hypothetical protein